MGDFQTAQQARVLATKPDGWRSVPGKPRGRKKEPTPANAPLTSMCALCHTHMHNHMHTREHAHTPTP